MGTRLAQLEAMAAAGQLPKHVKTMLDDGCPPDLIIMPGDKRKTTPEPQPAPAVPKTTPTAPAPASAPQKETTTMQTKKKPTAKAKAKPKAAKSARKATSKAASAAARTAAGDRARYPWATAEEKAKAGNIPAAPDFSAPTHERFRPLLAEVVAAAKEGSVAKLRAIKIAAVSSSPKAVDRYRKLCVMALEAKK